VDAEDRGPPARGADVVQQGPDRRRLAGAVGAEEAEGLALVDLEVQVDDPAMLAVGLGALLGLDDRCHAISFFPALFRSARKRAITRGTSTSTNPITSRNSSSLAFDSAGRSSIAARPRSAIRRIWRYSDAALMSIESSASAGALKYSRRSPGRVVRRTRPALASSRAVPLIAPRLACSASAISAAVCSPGSQMSRQPRIRPAIGVMPREARNWPISSTNSRSPGVTGVNGIPFISF